LRSPRWKRTGTEREARIDDRVVAREDRAVAIRHVDDGVVRERIVGRVEIEDPRPRSRRRLIFGEHVAVVEALPARAAALLEDQELRRIARAGIGGVGRPGDADRTVAGLGIELMLDPAVPDLGRRDRLELAEIFVDARLVELDGRPEIQSGTTTSDQDQADEPEDHDADSREPLGRHLLRSFARAHAAGCAVHRPTLSRITDSGPRNRRKTQGRGQLTAVDSSSRLPFTTALS
jgi:hypothetical protein